MNFTVTGAGGLIGAKLVERLRARGDEVTTLSRNPSSPGAVAWQPEQEPAPAAALAGRDGVVHLAGEEVAQRWSDDAKRRIRASRELGTRNLVAGSTPPTRARACSSPPPRSATTARTATSRSTSRRRAGDDFLAEVCVVWEREARRAAELGLRVVCVRTGVVLDRGAARWRRCCRSSSSASAGPVAGGDQYMPWIHVDDVVGIYLAALDGDDWRGPVNATAPEPVTNKDVLQGARARAAPARVRARARPRGARALRRDGRDRHHGPARAPAPRAGARVRVRAPGPRRGPPNTALE